jgi:hypothetical protein
MVSLLFWRCCLPLNMRVPLGEHIFVACVICNVLLGVDIVYNVGMLSSLNASNLWVGWTFGQTAAENLLQTYTLTFAQDSWLMQNCCCIAVTAALGATSSTAGDPSSSSSSNSNSRSSSKAGA